MAKQQAVWGIDIGQCALKALRCVTDKEGNLVADRFDYIEYPKILSSPEAEPEVLVREALQQFLSRNELGGDKVSICVPGQAGLSRFFKPPPVEVKTLPDIVRYEVKQQIPFPIEDVIWDWQQIGGTVVDGRTLDAEVGLFAMKRDAVFRSLRPFDDAEIDVTQLQLTPLALHNFVCHDIIDKIPNADEIDSENPPPFYALMAIGTDTTDLVVTNGLKLWLRNIPIGGNHFTRQLARELKLTQAKAEHLKRNVRQAENPKAVFKAMAPVFNDLVNEVQRSLTFFGSIEKTAQISEIILLGSAAKLPGLRQYLSKQLELEIAKTSEFKNLKGSEVVSQTAFSENLLSFASCYGLCLQGLGKGQIKTNLLPEEIIVGRMIEAKKPWVLAGVGFVMLGLVLGLFFKAMALYMVDLSYADSSGQSWDRSMQLVSEESTKSNRFKQSDEEQKQTLEKLNRLGKELASASANKATWLDFYSALFQALPKDERIQALIEAEGFSAGADPENIPFEDRKEIYCEYIDSVYFEDLSLWFEGVTALYEDNRARYKEVTDVAPDAMEATTDAATGESAETPLTGKSGWVIEIKGHHFHNSQEQNLKLMDADYFVMKTLVQDLESRDDFIIPTRGVEDPRFSGSDIGIFYPTIIQKADPREVIISYDPDAFLAAGATGGRGGDIGTQAMGGLGGGGRRADLGENDYAVKRFDFIVQIAWIPRSAEERVKHREERLEKERLAKEAEEQQQLETE